MRFLLAILLLTALAAPARADSAREFASPSGDSVVVVTPLEEVERRDTRPAAEHRYRGVLHRVQHGKRELVWDVVLTTGWGGMGDVLVADGGRHVVVLDDWLWHVTDDSDDVMAIYGADGGLVARRSVADLAGPENLEELRRSVSNLHWSNYEHWLDPVARELYFVTEVGPRAVRLSDGTPHAPTATDGTASLRNLFPRIPPGAVDLAAGDPDAAPLLVRALEDPRVPLPARLHAAVALGRSGDRRGAPLMREAAESREWRTAAYALEHLARVLPASEALPILQARLTQSAVFIPEAAGRGLEALGAEALVALLEDRRAGSSARGGAARALGQLKSREALPHLRAAMADPDESVAGSALWAVVEIAAAEAAGDVERFMVRGGTVDDRFLAFFSEHSRPSVVPFLVAALEHAEAHPPEDSRNDPRERILKALRFQTDVDVGWDARAWLRWLAAPEPERGRVLAELGDPAALLHMEEPELLRWLSRTPRVVSRLDIGTYNAQLRFRADGRSVVAVGVAAYWIIDAATGEFLGPRHLPRLHAVQVSPQGDSAVILPLRSPARLLDALTGRPLGPELPEAFGDPFRMLDRTRILASPNPWTTVTAWDAAAARKLYALPEPEARHVVQGAVGAAIRAAGVTFFRTSDGRVLGSTLVQDPGDLEPFFTRDGRHLILDAASVPVAGGPAVSLPRRGEPAAAGAGATVFLLTSARRVQAFSAATGEPTGPAFDHPADVTALAVSPDGAWLATGCVDGSARLWDLSRGVPHGLPMRLRDGSEVGGLSYRGDGAWLLVQGDHESRVYDLRPDVRLPRDLEARRLMLRAWVGLHVEEGDR